MADLNAPHRSQTRSGKAYTTYSLPPSFSLASALQRAVEEDDGVEKPPDSDSDDDMGEVKSTINASASTSARIAPLAAERLGSGFTPVATGADTNPFTLPPFRRCSVTIEELIDTDAPPPPKRKASTPEAVGEEARARSRFQSPSSPSFTSPPAAPGPSINRATLRTPGEDAINGDWDNEGNETGGVQRKLTGRERRRNRKNEDRANKRKVLRAREIETNTRRPRKRDVDLRVSKDKVIPTDVNIRTLPADSSGYGATYANATDDEREVLSKEKLESEGYTVVEWDGREPLLFEEAETKRLVVIAVGIPEDEAYVAACDTIHKTFLRLGDENDWEEKYVDHKRGRDWAAVNMGTAYGFGNDPYNQANEGHEHVAAELLSSPELRRIAIHQSESLRFYVPGVFDYYHKRTRLFREANTHLKINWTGSVYSSAACNLGPQVATFFHRDCMNLPFGFCAIHAFGNYDYTKGGHLVLKELKLIVQFPPGALILIPSATITHGNIPVREGETRTSFTQYTAGALFRFVDNGFRSEKKFKKRDAKGYMKMLEEKPKRWAMGLGLWGSVEDVLQRFKAPPVVVPL